MLIQLEDDTGRGTSSRVGSEGFSHCCLAEELCLVGLHKIRLPEVEEGLSLTEPKVIHQATVLCAW